MSAPERNRAPKTSTLKTRSREAEVDGPHNRDGMRLVVYIYGGRVLSLVGRGQLRRGRAVSSFPRSPHVVLLWRWSLFIAACR